MMNAQIRTRSANLQWRSNYRKSDEEVQRLTIKSREGDRVWFAPGPGCRVSGTLREWKEEGLAVVEVDADDQGFERHPINVRDKIAPITSVMHVPVKR